MKKAFTVRLDPSVIRAIKFAALADDLSIEAWADDAFKAKLSKKQKKTK